MAKQRNTLAMTALLALVVGGCSSAGEEKWAEASPETQGYRWVGEGEPANFGSSYAFCRSTLRTESEGARLQGGAGTYGFATGGGPTTVPGYSRSSQGRPSDLPDNRQFRGCMQAQGWELTEAAQPAPAAPAAPRQQQPTPSPEPATPPGQ
ncbi:MAG: hypothetical protein ACM3Q0_00130 [Bacteroidota bacterium]